MQWQIRAKIGKTIRAIDRGMDSVNTIVTYLFLTLLPALAEAAAVIVIFVNHYGQWDTSGMLLVGLVLFGTRRRRRRPVPSQPTSLHLPHTAE